MEHEPLETGRSVGGAIRDITIAMSDVVRSEVRLAKAEMKDTGSKLGRQGLRAGLCGVFLFLGIFPLLSFLVIGVGVLLGGNYWLSSLIFAVVFLATGGLLAYRFYEKMRQEDYLFPETRTTMMNETEELRNKVRDFSSKRRAG